MTLIMDNTKSNVLIFPYPAPGHLLPLLDLTNELAIHGLTITILVTPKNLPFLNPILSTHPSIKTLVLPFPPHPSIPLGVENGKDLPAHFTPIIIHALSQLYHPLLDWFKSHPSPPVAIISDMFLGWTHRLAVELNIHRIVFSPSGASALSIIYSQWRDTPRKDENGDVSFPNIPNCPTFSWRQMTLMYRTYIEKRNPATEFVRSVFVDDVASWGLLINSFTELERVYFDCLRKELGHDRVWAIGPLFATNKSNGIERGGPSSVLVDHVMTWLDKCKDQEVVYICFGSHVVLSIDQMEGLALGLEKSGVRFIWCVKEPTDGHVEGGFSKIPSGFEDRVAGKGLVLKGWVPQVMILDHQSVGAFLTHCGWNSVLEGLMAGVPMLTWPMGADQFMDAKLLVDDLKVGRRVCEGADTVPSPAELAQVLVESVSKNSVERERVKQLRNAALAAIKDGEGSSVTNFDGLVHHLAKLEEIKLTNLVEE